VDFASAPIPSLAGDSSDKTQQKRVFFWSAWSLLYGEDGGKSMIQTLFNQSNYVVTKKLLDATVLRHQAIAGNLANVETPNYKRLDVAPSFQAELSNAVKANDPGQIANIPIPTLSVDPMAVASNRDGNSVNLEQEMLAMNENSLAHTLEAQLITGSMLKLRMAITGRS
jgi:flagellar basal-body rod protein FlgB